jgi:hypothetical protein
LRGDLAFPKQKSPGRFRGFPMLCIQYRGWSITHTPRESAELARVFACLGLDKAFRGIFFMVYKLQTQIPLGNDKQKRLKQLCTNCGVALMGEKRVTLQSWFC